MRVCVVGAGHIGLPTGCLIADAGYDVIETDVKEEIVDKINAGESHVHENGVPELVKKVVNAGKLKATTDVIGAIKKADVILVIVPTPLGLDGPNMNAINTAGKTIAKGLKRGALIILESTVYPETTEKHFKELIEKTSNMECGSDFYLAYSPERAMPTKTLYEIKNNARIVGGVDEKSGEKAKEFYEKFIDGEVVLVDNSTVAEFIKLTENIYRDVNIALANEIAAVAAKLKIDVEQIIELANMHPRVNIHRPGAGVGGHCLPKDPYFLINKARELGVETELINTARKINEKMPEEVVNIVEKGLGKLGKSVENSKIAVLGYAYKGDTSDYRGTPSIRIVHELQSLGGKVAVHDYFVLSDGIRIEQDVDSTVQGADCIIVVTDHSDYRKLNIEKLAKECNSPALFVDGRNMFDRKETEKAGFKYCGIGH
ncbi:nucleotide sugar dehydrogenase [Candidatus Undinarchaeota archaeon]